MIIDDKGIIVLSASQSDSVSHLSCYRLGIFVIYSLQNSKIITKRYALSQFRTPYIPDQDRQELPHSMFRQTT